jgi:hypothetical protein
MRLEPFSGEMGRSDDHDFTIGSLARYSQRRDEHAERRCRECFAEQSLCRLESLEKIWVDAGDEFWPHLSR